MSSNIKRFYEFENFRFDAEKKVLWRGGEIVGLTPKASEVLSMLIESRGDLVERQEILEKVWRDTFVEEGVVNHAISALRKALGENGIIQTVPRRGYRFTSEVREIENGDLVIERRRVSQTLIEEVWDDEIESPRRRDTESSSRAKSKRRRRVVLAALILFALSAGGALWHFRAKPAADVNRVKTITVVPFRSPNGADDDKAFGFGITESLVSRLGSLPEIIVRPTESVSRVAESDPLEVGRRSRVDAILTGSFQRDIGRLRMTVRLLRVEDGAQLWAESFDEKETDIFKLQDLLAARTAQQLLDRLTPRAQQQLAARPTEDFEAYKLYLRGRNSWEKRTTDGIWESIRAYQAAIDRDPAFAAAYAGLANAYVLLNEYNAAAPAEAYPKAKAAAQKALEIDPDLVEAQTTIAYVRANYDWNFTEAEREYRRAVELNPNYATAHQWYGELLYMNKRFADGEIELRRAAELDPLSPVIASEIGFLKYYERNFDEAIAIGDKIKQEFPNFPSSYLFSSWAYEQKRMPEEAFANEIAFWKLQGVNEATIREMERAFRAEGYAAYLRKIAEMLEGAAASGRLFHDYRLVHIYSRLQHREKTLEWLEKAVRHRSATVNRVNVDPNFDFLRDDARFQEITGNLNLK